MPEDKKTAGHKPCRETGPEGKGQPVARPRAPNQGVLPGILGKQLKAAYSELLNTPIPDAFTDLIKRLESQEAPEGAAPAKKARREESDQ
jgi:hypothetical protein